MPREPFQFPEPPCPFTLPYTRERMAWCLDVIGWSNNEAARRLEMTESDFRKMLGGTRHIPDIVGFWFEMHAGFQLQFPKPIGWRVRPPVVPVRLLHGSADLGVYPSYRIALQAAEEEGLVDDNGMLLSTAKIRPAAFEGPPQSNRAHDDDLA